jgi:hypothetical protein
MHGLPGMRYRMNRLPSTGEQFFAGPVPANTVEFLTHQPAGNGFTSGVCVGMLKNRCLGGFY